VPPYGENVYRNFWSNHYKEYLKEGYIMVVQDVRGRWMSEGVFEDVRPYKTDKKANDFDEASDTYDAIDWLVKNLPNNNEKVGAFGISYPGFYSTMAALSNHPALKPLARKPRLPTGLWVMTFTTMVPSWKWMALISTSVVGLAFRALSLLLLAPRVFRFRPKTVMISFCGAVPYPNLTRFAGDSVRFWNDMMQHPNLDAWWKARNVRNFVSAISPTIATLVVGGLFDAEDCFGAWSTYAAIEGKAKNNNKIIMGPWFHGQWAGRGSDGRRWEMCSLVAQPARIMRKM
jgi:predicted acyl esterase